MNTADGLRSDLGYVVVGSAPGAIKPDITFAHYTIAANGGGAICAQWGMPVDILCTTSHLFRHSASEAERLTAGSLWNLPIREGVFIDTSSHAGFVLRVQTALRCPRFDWVSKADREAVVTESMRRAGRHGHSDPPYGVVRVSTGVWAACLAVASGSPHVLVTGIDPDSQGHHGIDADGPPRDHVDEDRAVLGALESAGLVEVLR